jgi:hypothetical protein
MLIWALLCWLSATVDTRSGDLDHAAILADSIRARADAPSVVLLDGRVVFDVQLDERDGRLRGQETRVYDWLCTDRAGAHTLAQVTSITGARRRQRDFSIQVIAPGGSFATYERGDLEWRTAPAGSGRVHYDDREIATTWIPQVMPGARVVISERYEIVLHGIPVLPLGVNESAWIRDAIEVRLPASHAIDYRILPEARSGKVLHETSNEKKKSSHRWSIGPGDARREGRDSLPWIVVQVVEAPSIRANTISVGSDWQTVGRNFRARVNDLCAVDPEIERQAHTLASRDDPLSVKLDAVQRFMELEMHYLGLIDEHTEIFPPPAVEVLRSGFGDCKGLSALSVALLRALAVKSELVLLATTARPVFAADLPNLAQFDHCIVWADDGQGGVWMDPAAPGWPAGRLPNADLRWPRLTLHETGPRLDTKPRGHGVPGVVEVVGRAEITLQGRLRLHAAIRLSENIAFQIRALRRTRILDGESLVLSLLADALGRPTLHRLEVEWDRNPGREIEVTFDLSFDTPLPAGSGQIFLPPMFIDGLFEYPTESTDVFEFAVGTPRLAEEWSILVPDGYVVAPAESVEVHCGRSAWRRSIQEGDGRFLLSRSVHWRDGELEELDVSDAVEVFRQGRAAEHIPLVITRVDTATSGGDQ